MAIKKNTSHFFLKYWQWSANQCICYRWNCCTHLVKHGLALGIGCKGICSISDLSYQLPTQRSYIQAQAKYLTKSLLLQTGYATQYRYLHQDMSNWSIMSGT